MSSKRKTIGSLLSVGLLISLLVAIYPSATAAPVAADVPLAEVIVGDTSPLVSTVPDSLPWGVVGIGDYVHITTNLRVPVYAMQQIGNRMFVGGSFAQVQKGSGGRQEDQSFLAAFDLETGAWIEDWRPNLDASVYALHATADGKLIVGGDFTNINGQPHTAALAALDPFDGSVITSWRSGLERPWSDSPPVVRALESQGGWIYAGGNFSHQTSLSARTRVHKAIRVSPVNGDLDTNWRPVVSGAGLWALAISPDGSRVSLGGYQTSVNLTGESAWIGVVDGQTGQSIDSFVHERTNPSSAHVQAIYDNGSSLYYSGSQHYIFEMDTNTWSRENGTTYFFGGDGQDIELANGIIYNACHCFLQKAYTDSYTWPEPSAGSTEHEVNGISAHTVAGFEFQDDFQPEIYYTKDGAWDLHYDTRDCLWVGGDVIRLNDELPYRWARGFTRLCRDDAMAPSVPAAPAVTLTGPNRDTPLLNWVPSVDNRSVAGYEIFRDGELVGTTTEPTFEDEPLAAPAVYRIRAVDERGNASATTGPLAAEPQGAGGEVLIAAGSAWRYRDDGRQPAVAWYQAGFNDDAWQTGAGQFGFGDGDEETVVRSGAVETYFRTTFDVADPSGASLELDLLADDGAVVWINGVEVVRENIGAGPLGWPTWPTAWKSGLAENAYTTFNVDNVLVSGENTIAVSVHNVSRNNNDLGFDLRLAKSDGAVTGTRTLVAAATDWRFLDDGSAPPADWNRVTFNDAGWNVGNGQFGYGEGDEATVINEGRPRHITAYFRRTFVVANAGDFDTLTIGLVRDDGAAVYLNGVELVRDNLPTGELTSETLAVEYITGPAESRYESFVVPADALVDGTNVLAVEVHQRDQWSKDLSFDLTATAS